MDALLWVLQGVMAFLTIPSGLMTALRQNERVHMHGMEVRLGDGPSPAARVGGVLSAACGTALVVPGLIDEVTILTPIAALALVAPALAIPARRAMQGSIGPVAAVFGMLYLAAPPILVAWGRFGPYPL
ncbi:hypothetical protein A8924_5152 [Saccharopolyspora erythraea NRRL 2338]|uniref:Uncharacterized protein n=2 Tax=Saccharopolyspora erythraea TaxID=1836 RepID=A4FJ12_SACEN|nr:hypothetical protein [Saccharopolyspora erythraea]EQD86167.1 hypothetical protein N599_11000 [Saccharopolyspora erythraea D]PFG97707.1 hypothetical protein A8924_5152 [Saccharopolyspora erythraea NRRL 2338]QRK87856.1 hypothetical protein JQX30_24240 [Saccharopolyspora erythraea]CAM04037.1 hypothetical protein SACE_4769 [Saccharopolyspora erythraea NRRL 2338]